MNFKLEPNETRNHFIWRVYKYQADVGNLTNAECGAICRDELNENYDESAYRKKYEYFISVWNDVSAEYLSDDNISSRLEIIEKREDELYKQQVRSKDWVNTKRRYLNQEARFEAILDALKQSDNKAVPSIITFDPLYDFNAKKNTGILLLSDFHIGLDVKNNWNVFNPDEVKVRIKKLIEKSIKYCNLYKISKLYVLNLGDMISGSIHLTTRIEECIDTIEQTKLASKLLYSILKSFSDSGIETNYVSVTGNHDRKNKNIKEQIDAEDFTKIMDWYIQDKIEDGLLDVNYIYNKIDDDIATFFINGEMYCAVHGHKDNPKDVFNNMVAATGKIPKAIFMGHYHSKESSENDLATVYVNGSLSGVDSFAKNHRYFTKPSQTFLVLQEDGDVADNKITF